MSDKIEKAATATNTLHTRGVVPFTGGILFVVYAFFWPEGYGHWLGTIVHSFRAAAGF